METQKELTAPLGSFEIEDGVLLHCTVDLEQLEKGARDLALPEGVTALGEDAFTQYNESELAAAIAQRLLQPGYYLDQWEKRMRQRTFAKYPVPKELRTPREKAQYLFLEEKRQRLMELTLPASLTRAEPKAFPAFLHRIEVPEENPAFQSVDGVLYSKDGKTLIRYPGYRDDEEYRVPEGVEQILPGAFFGAGVKKLILPASLKEVGSGCFENAIIEGLECEEGLYAIRREAFKNCKLMHVQLPNSLRVIEDYAFLGSFGMKELTCESEELAIGVGVFSQGRFSSLSWWHWSEIPTAAFLNAQIDRLNIPEGVAVVGEYAFAGCYKTKSVSVADSVVSIGPHSFDLGATWNGTVTLPKHLYHYLYRLPPCGQFNKKPKAALWPEREDKTFLEDREVLSRQKAAVEACLAKFNPLQVIRKGQFQTQLEQIQAELARHAPLADEEG